MQRITRLTPLFDVLARIDALVQPVAPRDLSPTAGQVLAADVVAAADIPAAAIALRDGWAVRADAIADAGSYAAVPLPAMPPWVDAGDAMAGADAVAPSDAINDRAEALAPVTPGEGVLPQGQDARAGEILLSAGTRLTALHVEMLARARVAQVSVRIPREGEDYIIAVGGTGSGRNDHAVERLAKDGRVEVHGIAISPGDTAAFGMIGAKPVLLLPGRLDAATAVRLTIGRYLLARLSDATEVEMTVTVPLARKVASPLGLAEVVPVRVRDGAAMPLASGPWPFGVIAQASGWILVPAESEGYPAGTAVVVRSFA